jgi:hypothetical protein
MVSLLDLPHDVVMHMLISYSSPCDFAALCATCKKAKATFWHNVDLVDLMLRKHFDKVHWSGQSDELPPIQCSCFKFAKTQFPVELAYYYHGLHNVCSGEEMIYLDDKYPLSQYAYICTKVSKLREVCTHSSRFYFVCANFLSLPGFNISASFFHGLTQTFSCINLVNPEMNWLSCASFFDMLAKSKVVCQSVALSHVRQTGHERVNVHDLLAFSARLSARFNLFTLELSDNAITDITLLCDGLMQYQGLECLRLGNNLITDAKPLVKVIAQHASLFVLALNVNKIQGDISFLIEAVVSSRQAHLLQLRGNQITKCAAGTDLLGRCDFKPCTVDLRDNPLEDCEEAKTRFANAVPPTRSSRRRGISTAHFLV